MNTELNIGESTGIAGTLSKPSKMPGYGTSTSALECKLGTILRGVKGSVCEGCYAMGGNYEYPSVKTAHERRLAGLTHPKWVEAMATLIARRVDLADSFFRWHDSGDLQGAWHLANIYEVARLTPQVQHWLPTREKGMVAECRREHGAEPENLVVRISGTMIDGPAPQVDGPTSTVSSTGDIIGYGCPSRDQENTCGDCRACWDGSVKNVTYHKHT